MDASEAALQDARREASKQASSRRIIFFADRFTLRLLPQPISHLIPNTLSQRRAWSQHLGGRDPHYSQLASRVTMAKLALDRPRIVGSHALTVATTVG